MLTTTSELLELYHNPNEFLPCIEYTAAKTGFRTELIEKDFLCSLILIHLYESLKTPLVFKGGTSLAKIHAGFYRLSEDLDFSLPISHNASRQKRSQTVKPFKEIVNSLPKKLKFFKIEKPLAGTNESRQYNATISYQSQLGPENGNILFEISVREQHLQESTIIEGHTILEDFLIEKPCVTPYPVRVFSKYEAYAEKMRAALTRSQPAIRDFYDIHFAYKNGLIQFLDSAYTDLVRAKLAVPETAAVNLSNEKLNQLKGQITTELLPTLRTNEQDDFSIEETFSLLQDYVSTNLLNQL